MADGTRRARLVKQMEDGFVPEYDAANLPPPEKRSAYALEHIAFRMDRIDRKLEQLISALVTLKT